MQKFSPKKKEFYKKQNIELIRLVNKVKADNDENAFNAIKKKLDKYINSIQNKFFISGATNDDILQECLIALRFKSINDYDEQKGPFIKFAKLCIRRHIITELKVCKKKKNHALNSALSLDQDYDNDDDSSYSLMDILPQRDKTDHFSRVAIRERGRFLYNHLKLRLTKLEYRILVYYIKGYNYMEIVNILKGEGLLDSGNEDSEKKVVDNGLCRIKNKALALKTEIEKNNSIQGDMFMDLEQEIT